MLFAKIFVTAKTLLVTMPALQKCDISLFSLNRVPLRTKVQTPDMAQCAKGAQKNVNSTGLEPINH